MDSIKTRKSPKRRFLTCFRPVAGDDRPFPNKKNCSDDPMLSYVPIGKKDGGVFSTGSPAGLSPDNEVGDRRKRKNAKFIFSKILKAVWFERSLAKKIKKQKLEKKEIKPEKLSREVSFGECNSSTNSGISSSSRNSSLITSSSLSSSYASSLSSNSRSSSERNKSFRLNSIEEKQGKDQIHGKGSYSSGIGGCLILLSLFVLVFWGKSCAIVCTSTWLFFVPRWNRRYVSPENGVLSPEIDSVEYKKKVIMEGLLERNSSRG